MKKNILKKTLLVVVISCLALFIFFYSRPSQEQPTSIEAQFSPNLTHTLYKCYYKNSMSNEDGEVRYYLGRMGDTFSDSLPQLSASFITSWEEDSVLHTLSIDGSQGKENTTPTITTNLINSITVHNATFRILRFCAVHFSFDSLRETKDSIYFVGTKRIMGDPGYNCQAFRKGPITAEGNYDSLTSFTLQIPVKEATGMKMIDYTFTPTKKVGLPISWSYGIFKKIK